MHDPCIPLENKVRKLHKSLAWWRRWRRQLVNIYFFLVAEWQGDQKSPGNTSIQVRVEICQQYYCRNTSASRNLSIILLHLCLKKHYIPENLSSKPNMVINVLGFLECLNHTKSSNTTILGIWIPWIAFLEIWFTEETLHFQLIKCFLNVV